MWQVGFFRTSTQKEIDLLLEKDNTVFPIEVKKGSSLRKSDAKNFSALKPLQDSDIAKGMELARRGVGIGAIVGLSADAYPVAENVWAFPVWAI